MCVNVANTTDDSNPTTPMIERDYIMRMITQLTRVITKILHLRKAMEFPKALLELNRGCRSLLGADITLLDSLPEKQLTEFFGSDSEMAPSRWYVLGLLLKEKAEIEHGMGNQDGMRRTLEKSLGLLLEAFHVTPVEDAHAMHIDDIIGRLGPNDLPVRLAERIATYYEMTGRFARAEDTLLDLLDGSSRRVPVVRQFYERLLAKSDEELLHGNLPREELLEGLARIRNRSSQQQSSSDGS